MGVDSEFNAPTIYQFSPRSSGDRTTVDVSWIPELDFTRQRLSPISQVVSSEVFDTGPSSKLFTNLPWFQLLHVLERPGMSASLFLSHIHGVDCYLEYMRLELSPAAEGVSRMASGDPDCLPIESGRSALIKLVCSIPRLQIQENAPAISSKLQQLVPERHEGELSDKVDRLLNSRSSRPSGIWYLFGLAAYFVSNNVLNSKGMDSFLRWVIEQKYTKHLEQFLHINTPTIHAFVTELLKSAVRIKSIGLLTALLDQGVKFDSILGDILEIGDKEFTTMVFSRVDPQCYKSKYGAELFARLVREKNFKLAQMLVCHGVPVDGVAGDTTPLVDAVERGDTATVRFLLDVGTEVSKTVHYLLHRALPRYSAFWHRAIRDKAFTDSALGLATFKENAEMVALLLEHGATTSCVVWEMSLLEWTSLYCRNIYELVKERVGTDAVGVTIGDVVHRASRGRHSLQRYIRSYKLTKGQLERALGASIQLGYLTAATTLLQNGVSPECYTLDKRPIETALESPTYIQACELLLAFHSNANVPGILSKAIEKDDSGLLKTFLKAGTDLEEQGVEALAKSARGGHILAASFLLDQRVEINAYWSTRTPLQAAVECGKLEMVELLLSRGADINTPAFPMNGRTALQSALDAFDSRDDIANLLLDKGADVSAPPALSGGLTALEAICGHYDDMEHDKALCHRLLDLKAPVNRPNGEPSSALHGVIENNWTSIFARMLEPWRCAVINHMWFDERLEEDEDWRWEPRTPTQLAAGLGHLEFVKMLLDRGASINEDAADRFGRTALQAAASNGDLETAQFLLQAGADVNAKPSVQGGVTALQGAAISGNLMLAQLLLKKGAKVNAAPSFSDGRYAIEGAAERGRLDMVQLLLNAGAKGNVFRGTGFRYAIRLAEENEHFAIAKLLRDVSAA